MSTGQHHLECDRPFQADLDRLVDDAHAAVAQLREDFVAGNGGEAASFARPGRYAGIGRRLLRRSGRELSRNLTTGVPSVLAGRLRVGDRLLDRGTADGTD